MRTQEFFIEGANPSATVVRGVYGVVAARAKDESVAMTGESIASRLPEKANDMAVSTALVLLERAGLVARTFDPDSGTSKLSLAGPPRSGRDLPFDFAALEEKHRRDRRRLALMIRYVESRTCRHRFILDYFGDPATPAACTACDRCPGHAAAPAHALSDDEITIVQKALSCVARMNGRFGRGRITQVLTGSAAQEVRAAGLDQLSTYGLLSGLGTTYVGGVLDALVDAGCIEVLEGDYPLLKLTNLGDQGVDAVFPVIYPPQVAIVGFGRIRERPWVSAGSLGVAHVVTATLAADHRASDGHRGAVFLAALDRLLQNPEALV